MSGSENLSKCFASGENGSLSSVESSEPYFYNFFPENQMKPPRLKEVAAETLDEAFKIPFVKHFLPEENLEIGGNTSMQIPLINGETLRLRANRTHIGRELWIGTNSGYIDLSDKGSSGIVDVRLYGEEDIKEFGTEKSKDLAVNFLGGINERVDMESHAINLTQGVPVTIQSK